MIDLKYILTIIANTILIFGVIITVIGAFTAIPMIFRSLNRARHSKVTQLDALFLANSTPGFSKIGILNSPDTIGLSVYAALALEHVGAFNDVFRFVENSMRMYPSWSLSYLLAARYHALNGEKEKAKEYLITAKSMIQSSGPEKSLPQLEVPVVEDIISNHHGRQVATTSIAEITDRLHDRPTNLLLSKSFLIFTFGILFIFFGIFFSIFNTIIK